MTNCTHGRDLILFLCVYREREGEKGGGKEGGRRRQARLE